MDVIADRARNPVVVRRARAFIRVRDQRAADARARAEAGARRRTLLTEGVDALEHASDPARARTELDRLEAEFAALAGDAGSAEDAARFASHVATQRARLDAIEQAEAAAVAERAARTAGIEAREALIARAAEDAEDLDAHLAGLLSEWSALPSLAGGDDGSWTRRFADTGERTRSRADARARAAAVHDDVVALVGRIEALVAAGRLARGVGACLAGARERVEGPHRAAGARRRVERPRPSSRRHVRRTPAVAAGRRGQGPRGPAGDVEGPGRECRGRGGPGRRAAARRRSGRSRPEGRARAAGRRQRRR